MTRVVPRSLAAVIDSPSFKLDTNVFNAPSMGASPADARHLLRATLSGALIGREMGPPFRLLARAASPPPLWCSERELGTKAQQLLAGLSIPA